MCMHQNSKQNLQGFKQKVVDERLLIDYCLHEVTRKYRWHVSYY